MKLLNQVKKGVSVQPLLILIHGPDGVGKSTFASEAPNPIFIGPEKGAENLDVSRFPTPGNWADCKLAVKELAEENHGFQTVVLDSLDWMEKLINDHVCERYNVKSIELAAGGYGKGFKEVEKEWIEFQRSLTNLRTHKRMSVCAIAHSQVSEFNDPATETPYNRYELKLFKSSNGNTDCRALWREFVDIMIFANYTTYSTGKGKESRGISDRTRKMYTERDATFDAKNRFQMDFELPLELGKGWSTVKAQVARFYSNIQSGGSSPQPPQDSPQKEEKPVDKPVENQVEKSASEDPDVIKTKRESIQELLKRIKDDPDLVDKVAESVANAGDDLEMLDRIEGRLIEITGA